MSKLRKLNLVFFILSLIFILYSISLVFLSSLIREPDSIDVLEKVPDKIVLTDFFNKKYTYAFYFTIHSNVFALVYFLLIFMKKNRSLKFKKFFMFETITLFNLIVTVIVYWTILWPFDEFNNYFSFVENILLHVIVPVMFFIVWTYRNFILKEKRVLVEYKEFYKFLIYPFLYLVVAIVLYYSTRVNLTYKKDYHFLNKNLVNQFLTKLKNYQNIQIFVKENIVSVHYYGVWGNAVYYFLSFDNLVWWLPIGVIFGIFVFFLILIFSFIKINKKYLYNRLYEKKE